MRRVLHQDIVALARCLLRVGVAQRTQYARRCVQVAGLGDRWRQRTGKAHPLFGDGTLQSACARLPKAAEGYPDEPEYAACLVTALESVIACRLAAGAGDTER